MSSPKKHRVAQIALLVVLAVIGIVNIAYPVNSQTCDVPRYEFQPIHVTSWLPASEVSVHIDGAFSAQKRAGIEAGNRMWNNSLLACSGVTFNDFDSVFMPEEDLEDTPPRGNLVWQEDDPLNGRNAGVFMELGLRVGWLDGVCPNKSQA